MKEINLTSVVEAYRNMPKEVFDKYLKYFWTEIKENEKKDLEIFVTLLEKNINNRKICDKYFFWFKIPNIWKEFDLLRFWENFNINIEFKCTNIWEERIKEQLIKNKYYLDSLVKETLFFCFISDEKKLIFLDKEGELVKIEIQELIKKLKEQKEIKINNVCDLFNPSDFLISPLNTTDKFLENKYFLTKQQREFKNQILEEIKDKNNLFLWLTWSAWTWKTLLTYDIAKDFLDNILIVHCWYLNDWHRNLRNNHKWNIIWSNEIKEKILNGDLNKYNLIIIDEAQRLQHWQFGYIIEIARDNNITCIFSYDKTQVLKNEEKGRIDIKETENDFKIYNLKNKIRTNKEISNFIKEVFWLKKINSNYDKSNIKLLYFNEEIEARLNMHILKDRWWEIIDYTPSNKHIDYESSCPMYNIQLWNYNSHKVIWQEFDKVVVTVDNSFFYDENGKLYSEYPNPYYLPVKMLFQNMTRVRKELCIIVINNNEVMNRCLDILNN